MQDSSAQIQDSSAQIQDSSAQMQDTRFKGPDTSAQIQGFRFKIQGTRFVPLWGRNKPSYKISGYNASICVTTRRLLAYWVRINGKIIKAPTTTPLTPNTKSIGLKLR